MCASRSGAVVPAQAKRMSSRVEQYPHVVLRLEAGDLRAQSDSLGDSSVEIGDLDVEVHHRALIAG
ncbi:MAG: hypothetical protein QOD72_1871, partial [Acidimicrobiaceae bacterium]|nr:hypothetical protein [Acidimicrobiaceae bacterium]